MLDGCSSRFRLRLSAVLAESFSRQDLHFLYLRPWILRLSSETRFLQEGLEHFVGDVLINEDSRIWHCVCR